MLEWRYTGFHADWLVKASIERFVDTYGFRMTGSHYDTANVLSGTLALTPVVDQPLTIKPVIDYGHRHASGWYTSAVDLSWQVEDPDTPIDSKTGCEPVSVVHDTNGRTITCTAASGGVTKGESITIKIDRTSPKFQSVVVKRVHPWGSGKPSASLGTVAADEESRPVFDVAGEGFLDVEPIVTDDANGVDHTWCNAGVDWFYAGKTPVYCLGYDKAGNELGPVGFWVQVIPQHRAPDPTSFGPNGERAEYY
jgi:hypothetical protein